MNPALVLLLAAQLLPGKAPAVPQPQGAHGLRNQQYGLFLRPREASNKDGEPIVLYPQQPWKCMAWKFERAPEGVRLVNVLTNKSFEADRSSAEKHALIQMPSSPDHQQAETLRFVPLGGDTYEIELLNGSGVLTAIDSDGHGDLRVIVAPWKQSPAQKWQLVDLPDHFTM
jgi:hypothetical protein